MSATKHTVKTGEKCHGCGTDLWQSLRGFLRCACGQITWIERSRGEAGGLRFRYRQGDRPPATYRGWLETTE